MSNNFKGVWGTFEFIDEAGSVIRSLREQGKDYSVMSPFPHHVLNHAMGNPQSKIPFVTLIFGALGIFFGYGVPTYMHLDWVLPVSGKPIVTIPPFTIFGFELMVLLGGVSTAVAIFLMGHLALRRRRLPDSSVFKDYNRFSCDRFGVVVRCEESQATAVEELMRSHSAEEVIREY